MNNIFINIGIISLSIPVVRGMFSYFSKKTLVDHIVNNEIDEALLLISQNKIYDKTYWDQLTPLHEATRMGNMRLVKALLDKNIPVNDITYNKHSTALHMSVEGRYYDISELLIRSGSNINAKEWSTNITPLYIATQNLDQKHIELLLENNADPNIKGPNGNTPLHIAACKGDEYIVKKLLQYNANVNIYNNNNESPLLSALCSDNGMKSAELLFNSDNSMLHGIGNYIRRLQRNYNELENKYNREISERIVQEGKLRWQINELKRKLEKYNNMPVATACSNNNNNNN